MSSLQEEKLKAKEYVERLREKLKEGARQFYWFSKEHPKRGEIIDLEQLTDSFATGVLTEVLGDLEIPIEGKVHRYTSMLLSDDYIQGTRHAQEDMLKAGYHQTVKVKNTLGGVR